MNLTINAISAKRGGAVTYLHNVLPELQRQLNAKGFCRIVVWRGATQTVDGNWPEGIEYREHQAASGDLGAVGGTLRRLWFDQMELPRFLREEKTDGLFSSANFGPLRCPCDQVLLVRNAAYFDTTFMKRMRNLNVKAYYFFQRWLTLRCIGASKVVLFPTRAMLDLVARYTSGPGANWSVAQYGTRHDLFKPSPKKERNFSPRVELLNVSLYSDQKNLGTLLESVLLLNRGVPNRYHLRLTAGFDQNWMGESVFFPNFKREKALYLQLSAIGVAEDVNWKKYGTLPNLYRSSDIFVFPSYVESFGHPLVEAMASGLIVVAADITVNRELCGAAAVYFAPFDAEACAAAIQQVAEDRKLQNDLRAAALERAGSFLWKEHVGLVVKAFLFPTP